MIPVLIFLAGFVTGAVFILVWAWCSSGQSPPANPADPGETLMAIMTEFQPLIDKLNALPQQIQAHTQNAVQAAEQAAAQDKADTLAAATTAVDGAVQAAS